MSSVTIVSCDECSAKKTVVNHWKVMLGLPEAPTFYTFEFANEIEPVIKISHPDIIRLDYCGQSCVSKAFQRWLDTGSVILIPAPPPIEVSWPEVIEDFLEEQERTFDELPPTGMRA